MNGLLYKATGTIAQGGTISPGSNCTAIQVAEEFVKKSDMIKAVNKIYDGKLIRDFTTTEDLISVTVDTDNNGQSFKLRNMKLFINVPTTTTGTADYFLSEFAALPSSDSNSPIWYGLPTIKANTNYTLYCFEAEVFGAFSKNIGFTRTGSANGIATGSNGSALASYFSDGAADSIVKIRFKQYNSKRK